MSLLKEIGKGLGKVAGIAGSFIPGLDILSGVLGGSKGGGKGGNAGNAMLDLLTKREIEFDPIRKRALRDLEGIMYSGRLPSYMEPILGGVDQFVRDTGSSMTADYARRGLLGPGVTSSAAGIMQPQLQALRAGMVNDAKMQGISALMGVLSQGNQIGVDPGTMASAYSSEANRRDARSDAKANAWGDLAGVLGTIIAKRKKQNAAKTTTDTSTQTERDYWASLGQGQYS